MTADLYAHYSIPGCSSRWTIQRAGRSHQGYYRWRVFDDGEPVAISGLLDLEQARTFAKEYVTKAENDE